MPSVELTERQAHAEAVMATATPAADTEAAGDEILVDDADSRVEQQLAPVDGGIAAWRLLWAAFMFEGCLWGFPLSYGVFQEYYSTLPEFAGNQYIGVVGTIASGLGYIGAPVVMPLIQRNQRWLRPMIWTGCKFLPPTCCLGRAPWPVCILSLVAGSFATTLEALILTQGVAYGLGFLIFYYPILHMVSEYWVARRGMAFGILCGASGISGTAMPFIVQALLARYGYATTLRAVAVALVVLTGPVMPFLQGRLPAAQRRGPAPRADWRFLRSELFWTYSLSNLLQGFGYFFPALYLPSYAGALGLGERSGALLLAAMSVAQVCGQFAFGYLSDRKISTNVLASTAVAVAAVACLAMWQPARSLPPLMCFAVAYGFFAAGYTAMWARMSTNVCRGDVASAAMVYGLLNFGKGLGNIFAGPIGGNLVAKGGGQFGGGAPAYRWVVVFTGIYTILSRPSTLDQSTTAAHKNNRQKRHSRTPTSKPSVPPQKRPAVAAAVPAKLPTPPLKDLQREPRVATTPFKMPALTIPTDKNAPATAATAAPATTATTTTSQPRAASPPNGPPMSPITPPLHATRLPGDGSTASSRQPLTHTTQQTPATLPLAPGPEPIDFDANPDTIALKSAIAVLQLQRQRATADIRALSSAKEAAVDDPEAFVQDLVAGRVNQPAAGIRGATTSDDGDGDGDQEQEQEQEDTPAQQRQQTKQWATLPRPQDVVRCPPINWSQYAVVGDSLDKLHAEQVARPTQGTPAAYIPGHAGMYEFRGGDGRQEAYQGVAVPYNPVKDRVDRKATSKARK
ncbi:Major facilitator superfamily transporter [Cordyceps javanica]|uniref:Major facilitator superfamily transporter n=1 Tax=Cordyceps javanica TaxID=43265 RepID=A0A545VZE0_9HYPO|nr:Major facilitator superfamily transporter [Cordyceps javanica]TQW07088.1 Major facilitator superfamily transporter [Cordyceps javanica]